MSMTELLERPVQQMLNRGRKTLEAVLAKAGSNELLPLQTAANEVTYLMAAARLAIEELGVPADVEDKKLFAARLRGLERMAALRKAAEPVLESGQVCALLGVSRETVRKKINRKQLLALPKGGDRVFPAFQFKDGDALPGLAKVLAALDSDSPFVTLSFLLGKNSQFHGKSACELLQAGEVEPVLIEAQNFLNHGN